MAHDPSGNPFNALAESIAGRADANADAEIDAYFARMGPLKTTKMVSAKELEKIVKEWITSEPKSSHECAADIMNLIGSNNLKK